MAWGTKVLAPSLAYAKPNYACAAGTTPNPDVAATQPSTCFTPATAANTDGIDVVESSKVRIAHSSISTGDDHIAIKAADAPASDIYIAHNDLYHGHGMSIGSETTQGVNQVRVDDLSIDGFDDAQVNGLRIKTYDSVGGTVSNVIFANVCMRNVKQPLIFTPYYSSGNHSTAPNINDILLQNIHVLSSAKYGAGKLVFRGYRNGSVVNPLKMTLDNVVFDSTSFLTADGKKGGPTQPDDATLTLGPGPVTIPFAASSTFKLIDQRAGAQAPRACDSAFPPFPWPNRRSERGLSRWRDGLPMRYNPLIERGDHRDRIQQPEDRCPPDRRLRGGDRAADRAGGDRRHQDQRGGRQHRSHPA